MGDGTAWPVIGGVVGLILSLITIVVGCMRYAASRQVAEELKAGRDAATQQSATQQRHRIDASQLTIKRHLGSGAFGDVYFGYYESRDTSKQEVAKVAVKTAKRTDGASAEGLLGAADCFFLEVNALDFLVHTNIIQALGVCTNLRLTGNSRTISALVMEYMNGGSAIEYVRNKNSDLTHDDLLTILSDISEAGKHLCELGVVHRDIAARNVLVRTIGTRVSPSSNNARTVVAKLADFGLAKDVGQKFEAYQAVYRTFDFNMRYTAPEGFAGNFSSQSDVWSFGVLMWELYTLAEYALRRGVSTRVTPSSSAQMVPITSHIVVVPYSGFNSQKDILDALRSGFRLKRSPIMPTEVQRLMLMCWAMEEKSRPGFHNLADAIKTAMTKLPDSNARIGLRSISETMQQQERIVSEIAAQSE